MNSSGERPDIPYNVGQGASVPSGVRQDGKGMLGVAAGVHHDHDGHGKSAQRIERHQSLLRQIRPGRDLGPLWLIRERLRLHSDPSHVAQRRAFKNSRKPGYPGAPSCRLCRAR